MYWWIQCIKISKFWKRRNYGDYEVLGNLWGLSMYQKKTIKSWGQLTHQLKGLSESQKFSLSTFKEFYYYMQQEERKISGPGPEFKYIKEIKLLSHLNSQLSQICYAKARVLIGPQSSDRNIWIDELKNLINPDISELSGPIKWCHTCCWRLMISLASGSCRCLISFPFCILMT